VALALLTPPLYAPDEAGHLLYIHEVATHFSFPVQSLNGTWADQFGANEFYQPPLYYLLAAPVYRVLMPFGDAAVYGVRLLDVVLGVACVWVVYRIAQVVFFERPSVQLSAVAIVALLPTLAGVSAGVNNESLNFLLIFTVTLLLLQRLREGKVSMVQALTIGALTAMSLYTKTSGIVLLPSVAVWAFLMERRGCRCIGKAAMAAGVALLAIAPWWLFRNLVSYGDPLGIDIHWFTYSGSKIVALANGLSDVAWSFWFAFGRTYDIARGQKIALLLTLVGVLLAWRAVRLWTRGELTPVQASMVAILGLQFCLGLVGTLGFGIRGGFTEGRYLFPALPAVVLTMAFAVNSHRSSVWIARGTFAVMAALSIGLLGTILIPNFGRVTVDSTVGGPMQAGHTGSYTTWVTHREVPIN
jgi:4-amino-4-deoxy-L-arabinose transferase-like glycosyltransferase